MRYSCVVAVFVLSSGMAAFPSAASSLPAPVPLRDGTVVNASPQNVDEDVRSDKSPAVSPPQATPAANPIFSDVSDPQQTLDGLPDLEVDVPPYALEPLGSFLDDVDADLTADIADLNGQGERTLDALADDPDVYIGSTGRLAYMDPAPSQAPPAGPPVTNAKPPEDVFSLSSNPDSDKVIFLDFDGGVVENSAWSAGAIPIAPWYGSDVSAAEAEIVYEVWVRVAEDFAPFDVNVTTADPGSDALERSNEADTSYGTSVLITGDSSGSVGLCRGACGGIAYIGVFDYFPGSNPPSFYQPAFVFGPDLYNNAKYIAEAASHEAGHNLGLLHDGTTAGETYFWGLMPWAPIMGASYLEPVTQWDRGAYSGSNNTQRDLDVMARQGIRRIDDDIAENRDAGAQPISAGDRIQGVIHDQTDVDTFRLTTSCAGSITITTTGAQFGSNVDLRISLYDNDDVLVGTNNPRASYVSYAEASGMAASMSRTLGPGTWYVSVDSTGLSGVYPAYGSVGRYVLSVEGDGVPSNDVFPGSEISVGQSVQGNNRCATAEPDEPDASGLATSTWHHWTAEQDGSVFISSCSARTAFDTHLAVFTGDAVDALTLVAWDDDAGTDWCPGDGQQSRIESLAVEAGTTYAIQVDGFDTAAGTYQLTIGYLECEGVPATIIGDNLDNVIVGTPGPDVILAFGGDDVVDGLDGDDTLCGGRGNDDLRGNDGEDILAGSDHNDVLDGGNGNDVLYGGGGNDEIRGGPGKDYLSGSWGADRLFGGSEADLLYGGSGDDILRGGDQDDRLVGQDGNDLLSGEGGQDTLIGSAGDDRLYGGTGNDWLWGGDDDDRLYGGDGDDLLAGSAGDDDAFGQRGADRLYGNTGQDSLFGGADDDRLLGGPDRDEMNGSSGNDVCIADADDSLVTSCEQ